MSVGQKGSPGLGLIWGNIRGFDTGAIAYNQFRRQKKWKFVHYGFDKDVKHWGGMVWIRRKQMIEKKTGVRIDGLLKAREQKVERIKNILLEGSY